MHALFFFPIVGVGPTSWPIIGSTVEFLQNWDVMQDWALKHNALNDHNKNWGFSMVSIGPLKKGVVMLVTPDAVKHVLKSNFYNYEKGDGFRLVFKDFLGNGIFTADGAIWKLHRKVGVRMFSRNLLCEGTAIAKVQAANMVGRIERHLAAGEAFDLQQCFYAFTMDVFTEIAFGVELNSQQKAHPFAQAFDTVQKHSSDRFQNPFWQAFRLVQTQTEREIAAGVKVMKSFAMDVINGRRRDVASQNRP